MPVWPKSLYTLRASLDTARVAARLRRHTSAVAVAEQTAAFTALTTQLAATEVWQQAGVAAGMSYEEFRTRVAPCDYAQLGPAIERMQRGEPDVLWPGRCAFFAATAGTSADLPKSIPVTEAMLAHFDAAGRAALLHYTARVGHAGVFRGRHLFLGGSTALAPLGGDPAHPAFAGTLGGIALLNLPRWAERHLYEPGAAVAQMGNWDARLSAVAERTARADVSLLAALPAAALALAATLRKKIPAAPGDDASLQAIWPNLECYVHGGMPIGPYQAELRAALGPAVNFHEVYAAAEACIAAQDGTPAEGLRLLTGHGVFFEFVPMADFDETRLAHTGTKAVPLAEAKAGVDYALLLTTPGGLARYVLGDVVRFVTTEPPRLHYVGSTKAQPGAFGERVSEREIAEALQTICQRQAWSVVNFHVAPLFASNFTGTQRGRHEWWIELRPGTVATPTGPAMASQLDAELQRVNADYRAKRSAGAMEAPFVRLVMPGVFEHWLRFHRRWGGHHKLARCRRDRSIADELAQMTNFARD